MTGFLVTKATGPHPWSEVLSIVVEGWRGERGGEGEEGGGETLVDVVQTRAAVVHTTLDTAEI